MLVFCNLPKLNNTGLQITFGLSDIYLHKNYFYEDLIDQGNRLYSAGYGFSHKEYLFVNFIQMPKN